MVALCELRNLILASFVLNLLRYRLLVEHLNLFLKTAIDLVQSVVFLVDQIEVSV